MDTGISTVAQLRKQIEAEYIAAQRGLEGLAAVARHEYITKRMENMDCYHRQLVGLVGEERAIQMVAQVFGTPGEGSDGR
ncbi:MAG: hypothetical protein H0U76_30760 [Ktedonobacteraceae bacterium]|nr:hypothetical protein [Ktedonobacteraceae bacterium]